LVSEKSPWTKHLFICTNSPHNEKKCGFKGSEELRLKLKQHLQSMDVGKDQNNPLKIRVNAAGCLGFCERGIAAALYPEGKIFLDLKNDEEAFLELAKSLTSGAAMG
jgi:predicted metal-binding protein